MKNTGTRSIFSIVPVLVGLFVILSSCSTDLHSPITKRQHRKGFNVDFAQKFKPEKGIESDKSELRKTAQLESKAEENEESLSLYASTEEDFSQLVIPAKRELDPFMPPRVIKGNSSIKSVMSEIVNPKTAAKTYMSESSSDDEALSLLWLVIVVVLILWLAGFLLGGFGLGGLIHLLLLIALILLILWLLKII